MKRIVQLFGALLLLLIAASPFAHAQTVGAPVPFIEFNAATSAGVQTNGTVLGPNYNFGTIASEATGRQAVLLVGTGSYVSFTLTAPANAVTIHYAIPDAPQGNGITAPLSLYTNGTLATSLSMTSVYSWLYSTYTFSKTPSIGMPGFSAPHDFYNDVRYLFPSTLPAGTVVKLQVDAQDTASWYAINTADFEVVPGPIAAPAGSIDVTQSPYNADKTGATDSTTAIQNAIFAAQKTDGTVYLPAGTYTVSNVFFVSNVNVVGAGEWYTVLTGKDVEFAGQISPPSPNVNVSNLAIFGNVAVRNDGDGAVNGVNGGFSNSTFTNMWIQNTKVGAWIVGPGTNLTFNNLRILDTKADGINFDATDGGVTSSTIENNFFRNTQDDGIAMWSQNGPDTNITINQNTVDSPGLANNIAIYGAGGGDVISNNLVQDTVSRGGGIHIGARFSSVPFAGTLTISNNQIVRAGQFDPGFFFGVGAIWFWPSDGPINSTINLTGNQIVDSPFSAIQFLGADNTTGVTIDGTTISNAGTFGVHAQGPGSATISNTTASGLAAGGYLNLGCNSGFTLSDGGGNSGLSTTPICTVPSPAPLWIYPDVLTFPAGTTGPLQVAVINKAYESVTLGAILASNGFKVTQDPSSPCGGTLVAAQFGGGSENGWCLVDVSFTGPSSGTTIGVLTIPNSESSSPAVVHLIAGSGAVNNPPSTPTTPTLSAAAGASFVTLSWTASTGSTPISYTLYRGSTAGSETQLVAGLTTTSYTDSTAAYPDTYYYYVKASNPYGVSPASNEVSVSPEPPAAPTAPSGLTATATEGAVALSWAASSGTAPITYNVYRGTSSGSETLLANNITSASYTDASAANGTTYFYEVSASNAAGSSAKSSEASASTPNVLLQINAGGAAVTSYAADEDFSTGNEFSTGSTVSTAGVVSPAPEAVYQSVRWASSFNYTLPGLTAGASYTVRLHFAELTWTAAGQRIFNVAINGTPVLSNFDIFAAAGGQLKALIKQFNTTANSSGQVVISFTNGGVDNPEVAGIEVLSSAPAASTAPSVPTSLTATGGSGLVTLSWTASSGSTPITYSIYRGTSSGSEALLTSNVSSTTYADSSVTNGTTYYYVVTASNSVGISSKSSEVSATPAPAATAPSVPTGLSATGGTGAVSLSWSGSAGTTPITYNIYRGTSSGGESLLASNLTSTSYTDTGVTNGTTYYYQVTATNSVSTSARSAQVSATPQAAASAPSVPTGLTATGGNGSVALTWSASLGTAPITYSVYRGTSSGGEGTTAIATNLTTTSYTDTSVTTGTTYYYEVSASNSVGVSAKSSEVSAAVVNTLLQIDAGGGAVGSFVADEYFSTGNEFSTGTSVSTTGVVNPAPAAVYQSVRWASSFNYTLPGLTAGATYTVRLHFAELTWTSAGQRIFNVAINGTPVLTNFDVFAAAGGQFKALVEQFNATANSSGQIVISFTNGETDNPEVAGIELLGAGSTPPPSPVSVQVDAGGAAAGSYVADTDYVGGNAASTTATINTAGVTNPAPQEVYQTERWAPSTYTIPGLTAGTQYTVTLQFAETYWTTAGQRQFNVIINGNQVLTNFDVFAAAGGENIAIAKTFTTTANSSGQVVIQFTNGAADNAMISGIEVLP